ncbi:fumarate reductase/succinate dehydrogenase flavo protein domain-containing protein [Microthyrium microscopicum]|uniref:Fumarate reductase/succinate dehydrogenase flavo protein domain-containing protein n=1 Tax=Microthyrium microscopicum TaxID=703497 RepID=A0A6A6TYH2_9PEZI|nr:fumarate reductase/succinate dehydrogenase flavo protein domain-containing protein [Microthyrium microscopicum]
MQIEPKTSHSMRGGSSTCTSNGNIKCDVLIIGSGGAALVAALRLRSAGLLPLIVEKNEKIGGTSMYSGGGLWIPNTHLQQAVGVQDSHEVALEYLEGIVGDAGPASTKERMIAFLENGPKMIKWLETQGMSWIPTLGYPDYFPLDPGGKPEGGRSVEPGMFDLFKVGPWREKLNYNPVRAPFPVHSYELSKMVRAKVSWEGKMMAAKVYGIRKWPQELLGRMPVTLGVSMVSQLLYFNLQLGTPVWTNSPLKELVMENGQVTGAIIERDGKKITVEASKGVILAAGGFARNDEMRKKYQAPAITADWSSASEGDQGDAITAAMKAGAATALLDSAWWGASQMDPATGTRYWCLYDRVLPHSIIVDQSAKRFTNESQNYNSMGTSLWNRHKENPAIPSYLIIDSQHRNKYVLSGKFMPGNTPQSAIDSGFIFKGETVQELAQKIGLNASSLNDTVQRFNGFADKGVDDDFNRGYSPYDKFLGDPKQKPNPSLGTINQGPYYAMKIWPGDLGTKGGVLTDEHARALREKSGGGNEVIKGLYAVGNSSASVMGRTYAGPGATLGPGLTFAYVAANSIIEGK